jgi:hypothetical protein
MPKAYAVVAYRSIPDPEKLAAISSLRQLRSLLLGLASLRAATRQVFVNRAKGAHRHYRISELRNGDRSL